VFPPQRHPPPELVFVDLASGEAIGQPIFGSHPLQSRTAASRGLRLAGLDA